MKKKTHDEYVAELYIKNPTIEVIDRYIDANTKIAHHCLTHDVYWRTTPARALKGVGCEMCRKEKFRKIRCKTHDRYVKEVEKITSDIIVIGTYIDSTTQIEHYCKKHDIYWNASPDNILHGHGCIKCGIEKVSDINRKSHEQYIEELKEVNSNIVVVEKYINANTPILHNCLIDCYAWNAQPANILSGKGCPKCANRVKRTHEEYIAELSLVNPNVDVLEEYVKADTPIMHKCKLHNLTWETTPSRTLQGCGCPQCTKEKIGNKLRKSHEQYVKELKNVNPNIIVIDTYINSLTPILHKCLTDGCEWYVAPSNILSGSGCPQCSESKGEKSIALWLDKHCIKYVRQKSFLDCRDIKPLPFDFYLPELNKCIEYDGKQHFEPIEYFGGQERFDYVVKHDNIKNEYCKNNGIQLLRIPYFKDIEEELNNFLFI